VRTEQFGGKPVSRVSFRFKAGSHSHKQSNHLGLYSSSCNIVVWGHVEGRVRDEWVRRWGKQVWERPVGRAAEARGGASAQERTAGRSAVDSKLCRRCQGVKGADEFYSSKQTSDGLQSYCKVCYAQTSQGRRSKEPKEHRDRQPATSQCVPSTSTVRLPIAQHVFLHRRGSWLRASCERGVKSLQTVAMWQVEFVCNLPKPDDSTACLGARTANLPNSRQDVALTLHCLGLCRMSPACWRSMSARTVAPQPAMIQA